MASVARHLEREAQEFVDPLAVVVVPGEEHVRLPADEVVEELLDGPARSAPAPFAQQPVDRLGVMLGPPDGLKLVRTDEDLDLWIGALLSRLRNRYEVGWSGGVRRRDCEQGGSE